MKFSLLNKSELNIKGMILSYFQVPLLSTLDSPVKKIHLDLAFSIWQITC